MDINNVSSAYSAYSTKSTGSSKMSEENKTARTSQSSATASSSKSSDTAVVYTKSETQAETAKSTKNSNVDNAKLITQMKEELEKNKNQLRQMVESMLSKQSNSFVLSLSDTDMWNAIRTGEFKPDAATIAQAKEDVSENGYWGVKQTSERIVSFAKALSGNDSAKGQEMLDAFKKGYEAAAKAWGGELPDISKQTYAAVEESLTKWINGEE